MLLHKVFAARHLYVQVFMRNKLEYQLVQVPEPDNSSDKSDILPFDYLRATVSALLVLYRMFVRKINPCIYPLNPNDSEVPYRETGSTMQVTRNPEPAAQLGLHRTSTLVLLVKFPFSKPNGSTE
jgi:hypothetical protein